MIAKALLALGDHARGLSMWPLALALLLAVPARAQSSDTPPDAPDPVTLEARRHFKAGTKLYRDGNYGGALAEFEEAYRLKPGVGSLQNIALSQKGLFRYAEAAATLEQLLAQHASDLSDGERQAVTDAIGELRGLVATIRLRIVPRSARVLLDGQKLDESAWSAPITLNVGEHTLNVEAPGYAPERKVLRIAGGQREIPTTVELRCVSGFVDVTSNDPNATIAIDGVPKARRAYQGPVPPDTDHLLQVYRPGVETFEQTFAVETCKTARIHAVLEEGAAAVAQTPADAAAPLSPAPPQRSPRGFFGLLALDLLALSRQPLDLDREKAQSGGGFGAIGLRAGYRLSRPVALDVRLDVGGLQVTGAYDPVAARTRDYSLSSIHFGPDLKLMTTSDRLRFVTTLGAGMVSHRLEVKRETPDAVHGIDAYFSLELGLSFNYRQFLGEIVVAGLIDGSAALQKGFTDESNRHLTQDLRASLPMVGIGLRGGFSQWRPPR